MQAIRQHESPLDRVAGDFFVEFIKMVDARTYIDGRLNMITEEFRLD
jgi:hypothetical protein